MDLFAHSEILDVHKYEPSLSCWPHRVVFSWNNPCCLKAITAPQEFLWHIKYFVDRTPSYIPMFYLDW